MKILRAATLRLSSAAGIAAAVLLFNGAQAILAESSCTWSNNVPSQFTVNTSTIGGYCGVCGSNEVQGPAISLLDPSHQQMQITDYEIIYCTGACNFNGQYYTNEVYSWSISSFTINNTTVEGSHAPAAGGYDHIQYNIGINGTTYKGSSAQVC